MSARGTKQKGHDGSGGSSTSKRRNTQGSPVRSYGPHLVLSGVDIRVHENDDVTGSDEVNETGVYIQNFPPVKFNHTYKTPPERIIFRDRYNNDHHPRSPYINGFDVYDRVLVVWGQFKGYTGIVNCAGREQRDNSTLTVQFDADIGVDYKILPDYCQIIPYPQDERSMRIKYNGHLYMMFKYINGTPVICFENNST